MRKKATIGIRFVEDQYLLEVEGISKKVIEITGPSLIEILEQSRYKFSKKTLQEIEYEINLYLEENP